MREVFIVLIALLLICFSNINYQNLLVQTKKQDIKVNGMTMSFNDFVSNNEKLFAPSNNDFECSCGCFDSSLPDCPPLYEIKDVMKSANSRISREIQDFIDLNQTRQKRAGEAACHLASLNARNKEDDAQKFASSTGSFCLHALLNKNSKLDRGTVEYPHNQRSISIPIPEGISKSSPELLNALYLFIQREGINSISDMGAGVGGYGSKLEEKFPTQLIYRGYDGANDVEDYTRGYIKYLDLSLPTSVPKSDWVLCLDVGEYIPSNAEGMVIRNLTASNCKGIILSWKTPSQKGIGHVNLHNPQYLINIFTKLGYFVDTDTKILKEQLPLDSHFQKSLLVLRRLNEVC